MHVHVVASGVLWRKEVGGVAQFVFVLYASGDEESSFAVHLHGAGYWLWIFLLKSLGLFLTCTEDDSVLRKVCFTLIREVENRTRANAAL